MFGGPSVEHDVSVITAMQVMKNADPDKYHIAPLYWAKDGSFYTKDTTESFTEFQKRINTHPVKNSFEYQMIHQKAPGVLFSRADYRPDVILPCFHGTSGEDGAIQGLLEVVDVPYAGSGVRASAAGMDKVLFKALMKENNIPVLDYQVVTKESGIDAKTLKFSFPVIVKPAHLGSSIGVQKCEGIQQAQEALEVVFELDTHALVEPYLKDKQEVNVSVLGTTDDCQASVTEEPLSAEEILSFEDKYLRGKGKGGSKSVAGMASHDRRIPAPIEKNYELRITNYAKEIFKVCGCSGVTRVDFLIDKKSNEIYVVEINTIPGSLSFYLWEAKGLSFRDLIDKLVENAEYEYAKKKKLLRTFESTILDKKI